MQYSTLDTYFEAVLEHFLSQSDNLWYFGCIYHALCCRLQFTMTWLTFLQSVASESVEFPTWPAEDWCDWHRIKCECRHVCRFVYQDSYANWWSGYFSSRPALKGTRISYIMVTGNNIASNECALLWEDQFWIHEYLLWMNNIWHRLHPLTRGAAADNRAVTCSEHGTWGRTWRERWLYTHTSTATQYRRGHTPRRCHRW